MSIPVIFSVRIITDRVAVNLYRPCMIPALPPKWAFVTIYGERDNGEHDYNPRLDTRIIGIEFDPDQNWFEIELEDFIGFQRGWDDSILTKVLNETQKLGQWIQDEDVAKGVLAEVLAKK